MRNIRNNSNGHRDIISFTPTPGKKSFIRRKKHGNKVYIESLNMDEVEYSETGDINNEDPVNSPLQPSNNKVSKIIETIKEWQESIIFGIVSIGGISTRFLNRFFKILPEIWENILFYIGIITLVIFIFKLIIRKRNK